jgi:hypothetical protein
MMGRVLLYELWGAGIVGIIVSAFGFWGCYTISAKPEYWLVYVALLIPSVIFWQIARRN